MLLDYAPAIRVIIPAPSGLVAATPDQLLPHGTRSWFSTSATNDQTQLRELRDAYRDGPLLLALYR